MHLPLDHTGQRGWTCGRGPRAPRVPPPCRGQALEARVTCKSTSCRLLKHYQGTRRTRHHTEKRMRRQNCSGLPNELLDEASPTPTGIKKACYDARVHTRLTTHHSSWASGPRPSWWALPSTVRRCRGPRRRRHLRWRALPASPSRRECQPQLFGTTYNQARWDEDSKNRERIQRVIHSHGMRTV